MDKTVGEVKIIETEKGFRVEFEGERAKELLRKWNETQTCCTCC